MVLFHKRVARAYLFITSLFSAEGHKNPATKPERNHEGYWPKASPALKIVDLNSALKLAIALVSA